MQERAKIIRRKQRRKTPHFMGLFFVMRKFDKKIEKKGGKLLTFFFKRNKICYENNYGTFGVV
jgi:hypothetical protein